MVGDKLQLDLPRVSSHSSNHPLIRTSHFIWYPLMWSIPWQPWTSAYFVGDFLITSTLHSPIFMKKSSRIIFAKGKYSCVLWRDRNRIRKQSVAQIFVYPCWIYQLAGMQIVSIIYYLCDSSQFNSAEFSENEQRRGKWQKDYAQRILWETKALKVISIRFFGAVLSVAAIPVERYKDAAKTLN